MKTEFHQDTCTRVYGTFGDLSAKKKTPGKSQLTQSLLPSNMESFKEVLIFSIDKNYRYLSFNSDFKKATFQAYHTEVKVGGNLLDTITNEPDRQKAKYNCDKALAGENQITIEEYGSVERSIYETRYNTMVNENNEVIGVTVLSSNISEQRGIEASLLKSLKETYDYKAALDEASIVAITDQRGIIKHANDNFCKISGYSREELLGRDHRIINSGFHSKEFMRELWVTIANGNVWRGELRNKAKDGTYYWVDTTIIPFLNDDHKPYQYVSLRVDITKRKAAEEELKKINNDLELEIVQRSSALVQSEKKFRALIENSVDAVAILSPVGKPLYVSTSVRQVLGYTDEEILNLDIFSLIHPDDIPGSLKAVELCLNTPGKPVPGHTSRLLHKDGTWRWCEAVMTNMLHDPVIGGIIDNFRDITERKKAEEAMLLAETNYREIFEKANDAIFVREIETGRIIDVNQKASEITGYTREELLHPNISMTLTSGHPQYTFMHASEYLDKAAAGEPQIFEWQSKKKDGSLTWLEVHLKRAAIAGKERILSFLRVINDRKKAEDDVRKLNESLEAKVVARTAQLTEANKEMEAFTYTVSHDLRAPLRIIDGYSEILRQEYGETLDNEGKRLLKIIVDSTRQMGELIDDLLNFSRLGRLKINKQVVNMNNLVSSIIGEQLILPSQDRIVFIVNSLEAANCDGGLMRHVFSNLIANAIKYSRNKEKSLIEIGCYEEKSEVVYYVKDNGAGFDMKYADKLFGVFQRLHKPSEFEGTGVGLAIVDRIISRHGGKVWANAIPGDGATFYFSLPIQASLN